VKSPLVVKALAFATKAHAGVSRKWTGEPYVKHPERVAAKIAALGLGPEMIAAAYLHDVVEDTEVTSETLVSEFGPVVAGLVAEVTKPVVPGNRAARKAAYRAHLAASSTEGATIKLADMLDNSSDVAERDWAFSLVYLPELREELAVLGHGHPALLAELTAQLGK
jgi:(p)ppGpp synthase/HD superfamily hydrolase